MFETYPECERPFVYPDVRLLFDRRRRARRNQRWAIALCIIAAVVLLLWRFLSA